MKINVLATVCSFVPLVQVLFSAPESPMRDVPTHEQLEMQYKKAQVSGPTSKLEPAEGPDPSSANAPQDLILNSDTICFNGAATLVPKRAIIHLPKALEGRLKFIPGSKINSWAAFYAANRGWISTVEVTRFQAEGSSPIDPRTLERIGKSSNLTVAIYQSGPISVLPPKANTTAPTPTTTPKP